MLRVGFLPSDFNPMVLMLGESEDLHCLAGVLRQFARNGGSVRLDELAFCAAARTRLTLVHAAGSPGLQPAESDGDHYLGGWTARRRRYSPSGWRIWPCRHALPGRSCWSAASRTASR